MGEGHGQMAMDIAPVDRWVLVLKSPQATDGVGMSMLKPAGLDALEQARR